MGELGLEERPQIESGELEIREDETYRAVMAPYRREEEIRSAMELAKQHGSLLDRLVVSSDGRILKGYCHWEAANRLVQEEPETYKQLLEDLRGSCVVMHGGIEHARLLIRAAHLTRNAGLSDQEYNDIIADQLRDCQRLVDANLEELTLVLGVPRGARRARVGAAGGAPRDLRKERGRRGRGDVIVACGRSRSRSTWPT